MCPFLRAVVDIRPALAGKGKKGLPVVIDPEGIDLFLQSGELCAAVQIYPMAASTNWTTVKLESFDYDSRYADYIEYEEIELPIPSTKNDYMIADSDKRLITEKELSTLSENECWLVLDEIYARHGRIFGVEWVAAHFNSKPWYHGTIPGEVFDANLDKYMNEYGAYSL